MIMMPKRDKNRLFTQNCRQIKLLPDFSEIVEAVILSRADLLELRPMQDEQLGFRTRLSVDYQLFRVTEALRYSLEGKEITVAIFLDLLWNMIEIGVSSVVVHLLFSYHSRRKFAVKLGSHASTSRHICEGVPLRS